MKTSRGLTLLEVLTALGITAILLPVISLVFYNILTIPPGQNARLALNNEVSLLSSWLYNDVHHADSFTPGNGNPYYGNFTWTDYNQLNPEGGYNEYLITYFASCPGPESPGCTNSIVRQVILTNGSVAWPTPTSTSGPTATPTPTPTEIPTTQTYTYCSGGGVDKWAWARAWNNTEWFTQSHPTNPDDFFGSYARDVVTADSSDYSLICTANNLSWKEIDTDTPVDYGVGAQIYTIKVYQDRDNVDNLGVTWRGYGGTFTKNIKLKLWNYTSNSWTTIVDESDPDSRNNATYTYSTSSSPENYIDESTGYVTMLASADADQMTPANTDFGNALYFNGSASNTMTASSSVPTDTFTFEAWVTCTQEITLYTPREATSGTQGCAGQHYLFWPTHGGAANAGVGLSVGTNGISVYEHGDGYLPPLATYEGNLGTKWNHIAVVYASNVAKIYLNGDLVRTGLSSTKGTAYAPNIVGYGSDWGSGPSYFTGWVDEVRIWNVALTQEEIRGNLYTENPTAAGVAIVTNVYTSSTSFTPPPGVDSVEVLVVGGGGGGGGAYTGATYFSGGGGGAGGVVYDDDFIVTPGVPITVTIGNGGNGGTSSGSTANRGSTGSNSVFSSITAYGGGGGGGGGTDTTGGNGGSGGGGGVYWASDRSGGTGTSGQGTNGGSSRFGCCWLVFCTCADVSAGGGGGGSGSAGSNAADYVGGNGGAGTNYSGIFGAVGGASGWFGGGGGGGAFSSRTAGSGGQGGGGAGGKGSTQATSGTANTGGGGGGGGCANNMNGANGGSGIVIVQYEVPGSNLVGCWHFNDCATDILDGYMEDSTSYNNDGALSSPAPECADSFYRDVTVYTDYIALTIESTAAPSPTPAPRPTDSYPTATYTPQSGAKACCLLADKEITSPTDTCTGCGAQSGWVAATSGELTAISADDSNRWSTSITSVRYERNYQRYQITINEAVSDVTQIVLTWKGYGCQNSDYNPITQARVWNYGGSAWENIGSGTDVNSEVTWTKTINSGISNYFSPGTKIMSLIAFTEEEEYTACPRMYGWDGETYQFVDSAASGRLLKRLGGTNYPATDVLTPRDGYYDLMVREPSYETSYIDRLGLWAVDHPEGTEVIAEADGTIHTVSTPKTVGAVDCYGNDVTSLLSARDGTVWNPDIRQKDFSDESQLQDWIELTLPDIPQIMYYDTIVNSGTAKLIVTAKYNHLSLLQIWSYYVYLLGSPNHDALVERLETDYEFAPYFDYGLWGCIAFQVEVWNGSEWTYYTDIKITDGPSHIALLDLSQIQGDKIRVKVPAGAFDIDYVAVDYSSDKPVTVTDLQPAEAYRFSQLPSGSLATTNVLQNISAEDGSYAALKLGEWINYKFEELENAPASGMTRSFVIPCTGYYIPEGPEVSEDKSYNWPLLEQISYEPLAFQKWVYPIYVDWLNQGDAYDCNDYAWHYVAEAPFPARETLAWEHNSLNTNLVRASVTYLLAYRTLTIYAGSGGTVLPASPGQYYAKGTVVNLTATPDDCYEFDKWTGDTSTIADVNDPTTTITMNSDYTITATFKPSTTTYTLSLTADPAGCSYPSYEGSSPFSCGTDVTIHADARGGCTFTGWTPTDGVANPSASDTTVSMTANRNLTATFNGSATEPPTPEPTNVNYLTTTYLTQHVAASNFSLRQSDDLIIAQVDAGMVSGMGKYVSKQLTLYLRMRPAYQLPEVSVWGQSAVSILGGLRFSGDYNSISGNVKVNGSVTVTDTAEQNDIDGTLTCPQLIWPGATPEPDRLSYTQLITQQSDNSEQMQEILDSLGDPQTLFSANFSVGTTDWVEADVIHQYVFTGDVNFTQVGSDAYNHCWADLTNHELKPGLYYSPGTMTLTTTWDGPTSGTVTFIANKIVINNAWIWGWTTDPTIRMTPYWNDLLFWANGSTGTPEGALNGDILIQGESDWHACVSIEGVLFAPNGEIELAGSGAEGWFGYIMPAEMYEGALIAQNLTISGSHWNFYRW